MHLINEIQFIEINKDKYLIINLINGATDVINGEIYSKIKNNQLKQLDVTIIEKMRTRKYLFLSKLEYDSFLLEVNSKLEELETNSTPSFLIIPTYACNLKCIYCYEQTYEISATSLNNKFELVDKQFSLINEIVYQHKKNNTINSNKEIKITIMGGEPLLKGNIKVIQYILETVKKNGYSVNIVTNGVDLEYYLEDLTDDSVEHIQVTVDGSQKIHDSRRMLHNGLGSFEKIISNTKKALDAGITVYLRVNADISTISDIPYLADILVEKFGFSSKLKPYIYLLQDGGCSGEQNVVDEQIGIESLLEMEKQHPNTKIFYKNFHPSAFINAIFSNEIYQPVLRHCGASKNQYIVDYKGNIYKCWHGIGNDNYRSGTFDPVYKIDENVLNLWKNRSVNSLEACADCKYRYICGTGCPASKHKSSENFDIESPSCIDYNTLINKLVLEYIK